MRPPLESKRKFSFLRRETNETIEEEMSIAEIQSSLERISGKYAGAVVFCLTKKVDSNWKSIRNGTLGPKDEKFKEVLAEYYVKVYKP